MRLGVFGGTFNPVHFGHLRTAEEIMEKGGLEKVIFMPSGPPPLKTRDLADAAHRYAMTVLATENNRGFVVSDLEAKLEEKSFSVNTVRRLLETHPGDELFFILGLDAFLDIPNWWRPAELISLINFIVVSRPGYDTSDIETSPFLKEGVTHTDALSPHLSLPLKSGRTVTLIPVTSLNISSTLIRTLLREGKSIKYLLPEKVEDYIISHNLYL